MRLIVQLCVIVVLGLAQGQAIGSEATNAKTQYVAVHGFRLAYRSIGDGHPIVLATRFRGTIDTWDPLFVDHLAKKYRVITFDYPGVGYSEGTMPVDTKAMTSVIVELTQQLRLKTFTIAGWSWGGIVAQTLAVERPDLVKAVILIGTNPPGEVAFAPTQAFLERAVEPINDLADEQVLFFEPGDAASRDAAARSHERIHGRAGVTEHIPSRLEQFQPYFVIAQAFREDKGDLRARFLALQTPKLIIAGDNDPSTQGQNWFALMGQLQRAQLIMYSQTGHAPQHQHPELATDHIDTFLRLLHVQ